MKKRSRIYFERMTRIKLINRLHKKWLWKELHPIKNRKRKDWYIDLSDLEVINDTSIVGI